MKIYGNALLACVVIYSIFLCFRIEFNKLPTDTINRFSKAYTESSNCEKCYWKIKNECKKHSGSKVFVEDNCKLFANNGFVCGYDGESGFQECSLANCENGKHGNCSNEKLQELTEFHS